MTKQMTLGEYFEEEKDVKAKKETKDCRLDRKVEPTLVGKNQEKGWTNDDLGKVNGAELWRKLKTKNDVVRYEMTNYETIVLYYGGKNKANREFWHATGNSCLVLYNVIHELMGFNNNKLNGVIDYTFDTTRLYTAYIDEQKLRLVKELPKLGGYKVLRADDFALVIKLPEAIEKKQFKVWVKDQVAVREKLEALYVGKLDKTELYTLVRNLMSEVVIAVDKMRESMRVVFGKQLMDEVLILYRRVRLLEKRETKEVCDDVLRAVDEISFLVFSVVDEKIINGSRMARMGTLLNNLRKKLKGYDGEKS